MKRGFSRKGHRGQTIVEVMMALALFAVSAVGLAGLQKVSIANNAYARELGVANVFGQRWLDTLKVDAQRWRYFAGNSTNFTNDGFGNTLWLQNANATPNQWFRPTPSAQLGAYPGADAFGAPLPDGQNHEFCAHVRLNWLFPRAQTEMPVLRTEVRVHWVKARGKGPINGLAVCDQALPADTMTRNSSSPLAPYLGLTRYNFTFLANSVGPTYFN